MRDYELTFIVRSELDEPDLTAIIERVKGLITDNGGEVSKHELWGTRRLAYSIRNMRDGQYVFMRVKLPSPAITPIERSIKLSEDVLRHLFVRVEE